MTSETLKVRNIFIDTYFAGKFFYKDHKRKNIFVIAAKGIIGDYRGKTANGILMHSKIFDVAAIIDEAPKGGITDASSLPGVDPHKGLKVPIVNSLELALTVYGKKNIGNVPQGIVLIEPYDESHWVYKSKIIIIST